ncbi:hypothetical protein BH10ACI1_BH10ACI1_08630 [soil metagenome]
MRKNISCYLLLFGVLVFATVQEASSQSCKVADTTGTPLNVRSSPNGRILQTLRNDTTVYIEETSYDSKNRPWVKISISNKNGRKVLGWVFREFVSCSSEKDTNSTPKNSWQQFYSQFKNAVKGRNEDIFRTLLDANLGCYYWSFCKFTEEEKNNLTADLIFRELRKNNNQGWKELDRILRIGTLSETIEIEDRAYKSIDIRANPKCEDTDLAVYFKFNEGRWWITSFDIDGCGH